ncbi:MAG: MarC family protein [Thermoplasmata archaeon]
MDVIDQFLHIFIPIFVIVDPFASVALFISLTAGLSKPATSKIIKESVLWGFLILLIFALIGSYILEFFGISIEALMIAGGLLMLIVGIEMVREGDKPRATRKGQEEEELGDIGIVPLATPMLAGPGAISLMIILVASYDLWIVLASTVLVFLIVYIFFKFSTIVYRMIGMKGARAFTRVMGLLVAAFAMQYILNGFGIWYLHL